MAPPGNLLAVDARTGELLWETSFIPEEMIQRTGTANIWTAMSVDPELGLVYAPVSSPSPNYWGGDRLDPIPLATSVTAVDLETGEIVWSFQHVHHDIWDYDTPSAPTLVDIERDGETVPALVQATKQGILFVLDRRTGEPLFPVEERPVPPSTAEGEVAAPTQPVAMIPPPAGNPLELPDVWWLADLASFGQCSRDREEYLYEGMFTPPSEQGTLFYPGTAGATNWGGRRGRSPHRRALRQLDARGADHPPDPARRIRGRSQAKAATRQGYYPAGGTRPTDFTSRTGATGSACPAGSRPSGPSRPTTCGPASGSTRCPSGWRSSMASTACATGARRPSAARW